MEYSEPLDGELYYCMCPFAENYIPIFISPPFKELLLPEDEQEDVRLLEINLGPTRFVAKIDQPIYLVDLFADVTQYASDADTINLFPPGTPQPETMNPIRPYPAYFKKGIENLFVYKISDKIYKRIDGEWTIVNI